MDNKNNPGFMLLVLIFCVYQLIHISLAAHAITTPTSVASSMEAVILDNGNLVLRAGSNSPLWQSFDDQDTSLPENSVGMNTITETNKFLTSRKTSRRMSLQCGNGNGFIKMSSVSLPSGNEKSVQMGNMEQCRSTCLFNCSCTAYAYDNNQCTMWSGDLFGVQELERDGSTIYIKMPTAELHKGTSRPRSTLLIALTSVTAAVLVIIFGVYLWKRTSGNGRKYGETITNVTEGSGKNDTELPLFGLRTILAATNNFSEANKLGEGGFGPVYKGFLPGNLEVAIKRLSKKSGQGQQEFMNELKLIARLQHTNLVKLLGCCTEEEEMILIYEYMPNRSLDTFLFNPLEKVKLDWDKRFQIIEGIAQGILYIHKYSRLKIIHRDLKASNVLLDGTMNPKVSDFGMARIFGMNQTEANTNRVVGTYGYMSPEYARYGHFSEKLDVFSFGVLLLEIISGRKNGSFYHSKYSVVTLAGWAWELWNDGRGMEVVDASVRETCQPNEALRCIHIGFLCVQEAPDDRPSMSFVIDMLQANDDSSFPSSKEPAFSTHKKINDVFSSQISTGFSKNEVTISIPEGR